MFQGESGKLLHKIMETLTEGLVIVDSKGIIQSVNAAMVEITGYSQEELIGQKCGLIRCDTCFSDQQTPSVKQCELFRKGVIAPSKCVLVKRDGTLKHVVKQGTLLLDDAGQVVGGVETFMDITGLVAQERLIARLRRELSGEDGFQRIIGKSAVMLQLFSLISSASQTEAPVLIFGESGTGKEMVAKAIHGLSHRRQGPFIRVNCKALPEALLEMELFGQTSHTVGGQAGHAGSIEAAQEGTLFLDEVADLTPHLQARLVRLLCEGVIDREGQKPLTLNVRVIAATGQDLEQMAAAGHFREDLFYRLNVIPLHLPPLRERREDIPLLAEVFIERARLKTRKPIVGLSKEAMELLMEYPWPGNVRELINAVEYAFLLCPEGDILPEHFPVHLSRSTAARPRRAARAQAVSRAGNKAALLRALKEAGGKMSEAARILGVSRVTLWKWLKHHNIKKDEAFGSRRSG
jgi:two-component system response regulator HydG|uniref:PAS domain S-box protein n=1 Tax=Desulfobacca acetoxidans TaxID=60893 RepID=A0A7V6A3J8_9BACT